MWGENVSRLETNIFLIRNLRDLKTEYRLYRIRGLHPEQDEYNHNVQIIIRELSYQLKSPVTVILHGLEPHLVLRNDSREPPPQFTLVGGTTAYFDKTDQVFILDYENRTEQTELICQRFLNFAISGALEPHRNLWQPSSGKPFFVREPICVQNNIGIYRGFAIRAVPIRDGGIGLCIDVKHRYFAQVPLPTKLSKEEFRRFKGLNCVYRYGNTWFEIKLHQHSGLTIKEYIINGDSLLDYIAKNAPKPLSKEAANLSGDTTALCYLTPTGKLKGVPAPLCYPSAETDDPRIQGLHRESILRPDNRRNSIHKFIRDHLQTIPFTNVSIQLDTEPHTVPKKFFLPPDVLFGQNTIYSVRATKGAVHISLEELGRTRLSALFDPKVGPYSSSALDKQYLIWPQSVADSYGPAFLTELKKTVNGLYPQKVPYDPEPIPYNDRVARTFAEQGKAILEKMNSMSTEPGYGIVMIHETAKRRKKQHDELAAMVARELRIRGIYVSVIHTVVPENSHVLVSPTPTTTEYQLSTEREIEKKFNGYIRNVALTKVLLTNEKWPFVLQTPLHADLTIGIDVKNFTACFTLIGKAEGDIRTVCETSNQKEKLSRNKVKTILTSILRSEKDLGRKNIQTIVIHRDGRLFDEEIKGIEQSIHELKNEGLFTANISINFVEIPKSSPAPLRLFDIMKRPGKTDFVENPQIGSYLIVSNQHAYLCSTGKAFPRQGTTNPLHICYRKGTMPFENLLEDAYALTCLAFTRPEDCTRYPLTVKLTDIRLREHAKDYDEDLLKYGDEEGGEEDE
jgi:hypothetical protein